MSSTSASLTSLFGETLTSHSTPALTPTATALANKYTLVYFSAHWCPPCKSFTPKLAEFYNDLVKTRDDVELVFVSSDKDEKAFDEYFAEMPWLALPFADRERKNALSKKFKVNGIPSLVVLDKDGTLITDDGRSGVADDPTGAQFPWIPPTFEDAMPATLQGKTSNIVQTSSLDDKYLMLYFSAHWCPPCRGFTPELVKVYNTLKEKRDDFELVFASSDRDEEAFKEYYAEMPWLALPFSDREAKKQLSKVFDVSGIPSLIVLDKVGADGKRKIINASAKGEVDDLESFPWYPKPYANLVSSSECNGSSINDSVSFIVLCENEDDDEQRSIIDTLKKTAENFKQESEDEMTLFFYGAASEGLVQRVRSMCKLEDKKEGVIFVKLDVSDNGAYYVKEGVEDVTEKAITDFIASSGEKKNW